MHPEPNKSAQLDFFSEPVEGFDARAAGWGWPRYRGGQVRDWVFHKLVADPEQMTNLGKPDRLRLSDEVIFRSAQTIVQQTSSDGTQKLLLGWPDGATAETVIIPDADRRTACVSSQVGCPAGCRFCASGIGGVKGSLSSGQIVEQIFALNQLLKDDQQRISHVVFMGMGEPLANYANVLGAVRILHHPDCFNISARKITISTVGVPARMRQLAEEQLPINLAISLHAPNEALRRELIPWAEHFALDDILDAARYYFDRTGREVTLEYILLAGVNDRPQHARQLVQVCRTLRANVNLIRYNEVESLPFKRPEANDVVEFQSILRRGGVNAHVRKSRGRDIDAACGQLRRRQGAFTLMESLVLIGIFIVLLSIFIPYGLSVRESSRRISCARNLEQLRDALMMYVSTNGSYPRVVHDLARPDGYAAFTGADDSNPFAPDSTVSPNDVTASLWLLVRGGLITDLRVFVCPSSRDYPDRLTDATGKPVEVTARSNFRSPRNLSYSYASPFSSAAGYRFNDTAPPGFALMADRNPGVLVPADAPPVELARGNSSNHGQAMQNVLYVQNYVMSERTAYVGVGRTANQPGDNIYSARAAHPSTQPATSTVALLGVVGRDYSPIGNDDSYLVPTALDTVPAPLAPASQPATAP